MPLNKTVFSLAPPAKINWFLAVRGRRADGYHDMESLIQCLSLHDSLSFAHSGDIDVITSSGIALNENLVFRAARLLAERTGCKAGARITLEKNIPIAAGLGGGSSDAAHTLLGLNRLWGLGLGIDELQRMGAELGSDVAVFISGRAALVSGRGEVVSPVDISGGHAILLLKPSFGVSAGWAYSNLGAINEAPFPADEFIRALGGGDWKTVRELSRNDLESPVMNRHPEIKALKDGLYANGALLSLMSGSGSTVFGVFQSTPMAEAAKNAITRGKELWSAVAKTIEKPAR